MKLISIAFNVTPRLPGLRPGELCSIDLAKSTQLNGWRLAIRGQQVFFISPPGWQRDASAKRDPKGPLAVFEVPRADISFQWEGAPDELEAILKSGKYDSEPFGPPPPPPERLIDRVPAGQMGDA